MAHWKRRQVRGERLRLRGRPCREVAAAERAVVGALLDEAGPRLGLPALQVSCPETPRSILAYLQASGGNRPRQGLWRMTAANGRLFFCPNANNMLYCFEPVEGGDQ